MQNANEYEDDELLTQNSHYTRTTAYTNSAIRMKTLEGEKLIFIDKSKFKDVKVKPNERNGRSGKKSIKNIQEYDNSE